MAPNKSTEVAPEDLPFWQRIAALEPALIRQGANFVLMVATFAGFAISDQIDAASAVAIAGVGLVGSFLTWRSTRKAVTANANVTVVRVPGGEEVAGPASELQDGTPVAVIEAEPGSTTF